ELGQRIPVRGESLRLFALAIMSMVSLAGFVVVAHDTLTGTAVEQGILQAMRPFFRRLRQPPDLDLHDCAALQKQLAVLDEEGIWHMLYVAYATIAIKVTRLMAPCPNCGIRGPDRGPATHRERTLFRRGSQTPRSMSKEFELCPSGRARSMKGHGSPLKAGWAVGLSSRVALSATCLRS